MEFSVGPSTTFGADMRRWAVFPEKTARDLLLMTRLAKSEKQFAAWNYDWAFLASAVTDEHRSVVTSMHVAAACSSMHVLCWHAIMHASHSQFVPTSVQCTHSGSCHRGMTVLHNEATGLSLLGIALHHRCTHKCPAAGHHPLSHLILTSTSLRLLTAKHACLAVTCQLTHASHTATLHKSHPSTMSGQSG